MVLHIHVNLAKNMNLIQVANNMVSKKSEKRSTLVNLCEVQGGYCVYTSMSALVKWNVNTYRSNRSGVFLVKGILKIYSKFTGEHPCRSVISIKLTSAWSSPLTSLHIFRTLFSKNTSEWLLLNYKSRRNFL